MGVPRAIFRGTPAAGSGIRHAAIQPRCYDAPVRRPQLRQGGIMAHPRVVIVGSGFGGLHAVKGLRGAPVDITLIDRTNHHLFQPLLYQVATAALSGAEIAVPIRSIFRRQENVTVLMGEVDGIDMAARHVSVRQTAVVPYDMLVLATGSVYSWFGHDNWAAHSYALKTLDDAEELRLRLLGAFERAESRDDPAETRR